MLLGKILSIGKNTNGRRHLNMLSEDGNSEHRAWLQSIHVRNLGLKKGDWIKYELGGYSLDPTMDAVFILETPPNFQPGYCCGNCSEFRKRGTMFAPDMCKKYKTVVLPTDVCQYVLDAID